MVKPKLLDQVKYAARVRHMSYRTEQAYASEASPQTLAQTGLSGYVLA
jgi:hypothetical protein